MLGDSPNGVLQPPLHIHAGAFHVGGSFSVASSEADRGRELFGHRLELLACAVRTSTISELLGFGELLNVGDEEQRVRAPEERVKEGGNVVELASDRDGFACVSNAARHSLVGRRW